MANYISNKAAGGLRYYLHLACVSALQGAFFMCGICGAIGGDQGQLLTAVRRMMRAMPHRGPDDEGLESMPVGTDSGGTTATFGFRRLSILDLSLAGHQPMINRHTSDCLVFNGEIYNYRSIRERLSAEGIQATSSGDTEVLLNALSRWGEDALDMIDGMFALAFYQASTRRVLLARDPLGIKPLYVWRTPHSLLFASEVRMLRSTGLVSSEFDPAGVATFLTYGAPQAPFTVHSEVKAFPCGSRSWVGVDDKGRLSEEPAHSYWHFPAPDPARSAEEAADSLSLALRQSIHEHLASDVPIAFFLSGGIDSTAIAMLARESLGAISTYSVGFDSPAMPSELKVAAETARLLGSDHHEVILSSGNIRSTWDDWMLAADQPSVDGLNTYVICKAAKAGNAKVAFSGLGADELFGGYANFFRVRQFGPLLRLAAYLPKAARAALAKTLQPMCPPRYRARLMMLARENGNPVDLAVQFRKILSGDVLASLGLRAGELALCDNFLPHELHTLIQEASDDLYFAVSRAETYGYMQNTLLRDADTNSMANSIELRVPFLSRRVLDEAARTPGAVHLGGGTPKAVLRKAVGTLLPPVVLNRPKTGFSLPVGDWMYHELRDFCEAAIDGLRHIPFINSSAARALWARFEKERVYTYWMKPMMLVALGSYADQCNRSFIDTAGAMKLRPR